MKWGPERLAQKLNAEESACREALDTVKGIYGSVEGMSISKLWKPPGSDKWGVSLKAQEGIDLSTLDEMVEKAYRKVFSNPVKQQKKILPIKNAEGDLLIFLSDQHIGAKTGEGLYENHYDRKEVFRRMENLLHEVTILTDTFPVSKIHLVLLGDSLDGMDAKTTRGGHDLPQNMTNQEALECFFDSHVYLIHGLYELSSTMDIHLTANSNHGGDFEYAAHRMLQIYVQHAYDINVMMHTKFLSHFELDDMCYIITHGKDKQHRKKGLPKYLNPDTELFLEQYIRANKITSEVRVVKGDLHVNAEEQGKLFSYRNVPSFFGGSDWIMENFGITKPGVAFDLVSFGNLYSGVLNITY